MLPSPARAALPVLLSVGCGQYVSADAALGRQAAPVTLATTEDMASATHLLHYTLDSLLGLHTEELRWGGGEARHLDYAPFVDAPEAQLSLTQALSALGAVDLETLDSPAERQAFAYNLYNGWMIAAAASALRSDAGWGGVSTGGFAIFDQPLVSVDQAAADGGMVLSLNQLEHGLLRGDPEVLAGCPDPDRARAWHAALWEGATPDPRLHVALNCASHSCPDLPAGAWQAATLDDDLDAAATRFLDHPGKGAGSDGISALFTWYAADFAAAGGAEGFIATHRTAGTSGVDLRRELPYDWSLNTP